MLITSDEETGSRTSRALIEAEALASDAVLVLEPALAGGALKTSRKGIGQFRVERHRRGRARWRRPGQGRQRYPRTGPADPRSGAAARPRARHLGECRCRRRRHPAQRGRRRGARDRRRAGAVAGRRRARWTRRSGRCGRICPARGWRCRAASSGRRWNARPGSRRSTRWRRPRRPSSARPIAEGGTGGGSDGNFTAALGVPTLDGLGAIGDGAHARTSTSRSLASCRGRRCWPCCCAADGERRAGCRAG